MTYNDWKKAEKIISKIDRLKFDVDALSSFIEQYKEDEGCLSVVLYPYEDSTSIDVLVDEDISVAEFILKLKEDAIASLELELQGI